MDDPVLRNRTVLVVAPSPPPYGGMALQARQLQERLASDGIPVAFLSSNFDFPRALGFAATIPVLRTAIRALLIWPKLAAVTQNAAVVHVFAASWLYFFAVVYPAVLIARLYGKRSVLNYRGGEAADFFRLFGWAAAPAFRLADAVTAPSGFVAGLIERRFGVPVLTVPNILNTSIFRFRHRQHLTPTLVVTRHLERPYDVESVLRAFQIVQADHPEASLKIAGTGSEEKDLRTLAAALGLRNVDFLRHIEHRNLPELYDSCDIYLNGSRIDNFPGALLEASAAGLVVVTTAAGGIPWMYEHDKTALLVHPGDWRALASGVLRMLESPADAARMTLASERMARACDWEQVRFPLYQAYGFSTQLPPVTRDTALREASMATGTGP